MLNLKKVLSVFLVTVMTISMLAVPVSAKEVKRTWTDCYGNKHTYTYEDGNEEDYQRARELYLQEYWSLVDQKALYDVEYDKNVKIDTISKIKYYGKGIKYKSAIDSDAALISAIEYASVQGASSLSLKLDLDYAKNDFKALKSREIEIMKKSKSMVKYTYDVGKNNFSLMLYFSPNKEKYKLNTAKTTMFVYAYRYGHTELIKKQDEETQKLYNKCVSILKECGANDKNKTEAEKIHAIRNWMYTNIKIPSIESSRNYKYVRRDYGALLSDGTQKVDCLEIAMSFQLLLRMCGIKCWVISTNAPEGDHCHNTTSERIIGVNDGGDSESISVVVGNWNHSLVAIRADNELVFVEPINFVKIAYSSDFDLNKLYYTYDDLVNLKYEFDLTEEELEMYCKY